MNIPNLPNISESAKAAGGGVSTAPVPDNFSGAQNKTEPSSSQAFSNEQIKKMVEEIQDHLGTMRISINFTTYGKHKEKIAVTVSDQVTGKVIREIPPKELQQLYTAMDKLVGMLINGSV